MCVCVCISGTKRREKLKYMGGQQLVNELHVNPSVGILSEDQLWGCYQHGGISLLLAKRFTYHNLWPAVCISPPNLPWSKWAIIHGNLCVRRWSLLTQLPLPFAEMNVKINTYQKVVLRARAVSCAGVTVGPHGHSLNASFQSKSVRNRQWLSGSCRNLWQNITECEDLFLLPFISGWFSVCFVSPSLFPSWHVDVTFTNTWLHFYRHVVPSFIHTDRDVLEVSWKWYIINMYIAQ